MSQADDPEISALLREDRVFEPSADFRATANVRDTTAYQEADRDYEGFWAKFASELEWSRKWTKVLDWSSPPHAKWFVGGQSTRRSIVRATSNPRDKAASSGRVSPGSGRL